MRLDEAPVFRRPIDEEGLGIDLFLVTGRLGQLERVGDLEILPPEALAIRVAYGDTVESLHAEPS